MAARSSAGRSASPISPPTGDDSLPQFEIAFDLSTGGVLSNVRLDYGDFTLKADLEKLETFAKPDCN